MTSTSLTSVNFTRIYTKKGLERVLSFLVKMGQFLTSTATFVNCVCAMTMEEKSELRLLETEGVLPRK